MNSKYSRLLGIYAYFTCAMGIAMVFAWLIMSYVIYPDVVNLKLFFSMSGGTLVFLWVFGTIAHLSGVKKRAQQQAKLNDSWHEEANEDL